MNSVHRDPADWIDGLDDEHRRMAIERLHFQDFVRTKSPLKPCRCPSRTPALVLSMGPPNEPGARRRIECGTCHTFFFWLPKLKNKNKRSASSIGLASGAECQLCRKSGVNLVGHHIVEVVDGGSNDPENIWTVCEPCHAVIHALRRHALGPFESVGEAQRQTEGGS